ncbi:MAG: ATP phosphoribosyltransferase regulatory subunit [bacterium]
MSELPAKTLHTHYRLPPGVHDFLFEEAHARRQVERSLIEMLASKGYREIITPAYEYSEVFAQASKAQNGREERAYRFLDRDGRVLALRSDFTAQIARIAAARFFEMPAPVRAYYSGKVFRAEPLHAGKRREKWQVGFEILGAAGLEADGEAVFCILDGFLALGLAHTRIAIGHIGYFNGLIAQAQLDGENLKRLKYLVERKDVAGLARATEELELAHELREAFVHLPHLHGGQEILPQARRFTKNKDSHAAIARLESLLSLLQKHPQAHQVFVDLSEVEGMGYYTGIMLRAFAAGVGEELGGGGRYDDLVSRFGAHMPSVGFSFDVDLLVRAVQAHA